MDDPPAEGELPKQPEGKTVMYIGNNGPSIWREEMEVAYPVRDALSTFPSWFQLWKCLNVLQSSSRLRPDPQPHISRVQGRDALRPNGAPCSRHGTGMEYLSKSRTHGTNLVRRVPSPCILHRQYRRSKRVRTDLFYPM